MLLWQTTGKTTVAKLNYYYLLNDNCIALHKLIKQKIKLVSLMASQGSSNNPYDNIQNSSI